MKKTEKWLEEEMVRLNVELAQSINGRLKGEFVSCNDERKEVTVRYPLQEWEINGINSLHGGIIAAMFDLAMCMSIYAYSQEEVPPTVSLTTNFLRPVKMEGYVDVVARATSIGKNFGTSYAELIIPESGKIAATGLSTFAIPHKNED